MKGLARVVLLGNLTADPDPFSAGCRFSVAVNERVKQNDEWVDRPSFYDVTVFGKQAEAVSEHLTKGSGVAIDGRLRQDRWTTDEGSKRSAVKVIADTVTFLPSGEKREPKRDPIDDFDTGGAAGDPSDGLTPEQRGAREEFGF